MRRTRRLRSSPGIRSTLEIRSVDRRLVPRDRYSDPVIGAEATDRFCLKSNHTGSEYRSSGTMGNPGISRHRNPRPSGPTRKFRFSGGSRFSSDRQESKLSKNEGRTKWNLGTAWRLAKGDWLQRTCSRCLSPSLQPAFASRLVTRRMVGVDRQHDTPHDPPRSLRLGAFPIATGANETPGSAPIGSITPREPNGDRSPGAVRNEPNLLATSGLATTSIVLA